MATKKSSKKVKIGRLNQVTKNITLKTKTTTLKVLLKLADINLDSSEKCYINGVKKPLTAKVKVGDIVQVVGKKENSSDEPQATEVAKEGIHTETPVADDTTEETSTENDTVEKTPAK